MGVSVCGRGARQETRKGIDAVDQTRQAAWQVWTGMAVVREVEALAAKSATSRHDGTRHHAMCTRIPRAQVGLL